MSLSAILYGIEPLLKYELFTVRQIKFLIKLHELGGQEDLGVVRKLVPLSRPATCRTIDSLAIKGLLTRQKAEHDKRFCTITMTDKGRKLIRHMRGIPAKEAA